MTVLRLAFKLKVDHPRSFTLPKVDHPAFFTLRASCPMTSADQRRDTMYKYFTRTHDNAPPTSFSLAAPSSPHLPSPPLSLASPRIAPTSDNDNDLLAVTDAPTAKWNSNWLARCAVWGLKAGANDDVFCHYCQSFKDHSDDETSPMVRFKYGYATADITLYSQLTQHRDSKHHSAAVQAMNAQTIGDSFDSQSAALDPHELMPHMLAAAYMGSNNIPFSDFDATMSFAQKLTGKTVIGRRSNEDCAEFMNAMQTVLFRQLVDRIAASPFFSVMIDETSDVEHHSQLIIYVRYFNDKRPIAVIEYFTLIHVNSTTGLAITEAVKNAIISARGTDERTTINIRKLCGIATDGASNMTGINAGVQVRLAQDVNAYLIGVHCMAHRLQLASSDAFATVPYLQTIEKVLTDVNGYFSHSNKRSDKLREIQKALQLPELVVKRFVPTRWLSRSEAVKRIVDIYPSLLNFFKAEVADKDLTEKQRESANLLLTTLTSWRTLAWLVFLNGILGTLNDISKMLQLKHANIVTVTQRLKTIRKDLKRLHMPSADGSNNIHYSTEFRKWFDYWLIKIDKQTASISLPYRFGETANEEAFFTCERGISDLIEFQQETVNYCTAVNTELDVRFAAEPTLDAFAIIIGLNYPSQEYKQQPEPNISSVVNVHDVINVPIVEIEHKSESDEVARQYPPPAHPNARQTAVAAKKAAQEAKKKIKRKRRSKAGTNPRQTTRKRIRLMGEDFSKFEDFGNKEIIYLHSIFSKRHKSCDLFISIDINSLLKQWRSFKLHVVNLPTIHNPNHTKLPDVWAVLLQDLHVITDCPDIHRLAQIALLMPVTTVECERGFSNLKLVKTPTRNALEKNLNAVLRLYMTEKLLDQGNEFFEKAIAMWFSQKNSRRAARGEYDKSNAPTENEPRRITEVQNFTENAVIDLTHNNPLISDRVVVNNARIVVVNSHGPINA
jgi:hypothetical protein